MEDSIQNFSRNDLKDGYVFNVDVNGKIILKWVLNTIERCRLKSHVQGWFNWRSFVYMVMYIWVL